MYRWYCVFMVENSQWKKGEACWQSLRIQIVYLTSYIDGPFLNLTIFIFLILFNRPLISWKSVENRKSFKSIDIVENVENTTNKNVNWPFEYRNLTARSSLQLSHVLYDYLQTRSRPLYVFICSNKLEKHALVTVRYWWWQQNANLNSSIVLASNTWNQHQILEYE